MVAMPILLAVFDQKPTLAVSVSPEHAEVQAPHSLISPQWGGRWRAEANK